MAAEETLHRRQVSDDESLITYPLTSLQIGELPAWLSIVSLHVCHTTGKLLLFVDNSPWSAEKSRPKSVALWQFIAPQCKESPYVNKRGLERKRIASSPSTTESDLQGKQGRHRESHPRHRRLKWRSLTALVKKLRGRQRHPEGLCGCISLELQWRDVRGIHYANELQVDTFLALEMKSIVKREFLCLEEAFLFHSRQTGTATSPISPRVPDFPSTASEWQTSGGQSDNDCALRLDYSEAEGRPSSQCTALSADSTRTTPQCSNSAKESGGDSGISKGMEGARRRVRRLRYEEARWHGAGALPSVWDSDDGSESDGGRGGGKRVRSHSHFDGTSPPHSAPEGVLREGEVDVVWAGERVYYDKLVTLRFQDLQLPAELSQVMTADLRLLKLLESGLPWWALFCQSYPLTCRLYRPWMRPLSKCVYFAVSVATFLIGFYDLYKNVPGLRGAIAGVMGPVGEWIESWGVVWRLKYLGTMLVLHHCQRAFRSLASFLQGLRHLLAFMMKPLESPLAAALRWMLPCWQACTTGLGTLLCHLHSPLLSLWTALTFLWTLGASLLAPLLSVLWMLLRAPLMLALHLSSALYSLNSVLLSRGCSMLSEAASGVRVAAEGAYQAASVLWAVHKPVARPPSWVVREVWNEVFGAMRSVMNGTLLFSRACNRHRLSTYRYGVAQWAAVRARWAWTPLPHTVEGTKVSLPFLLFRSKAVAEEDNNSNHILSPLPSHSSSPGYVSDGSKSD